MNGTPSVGKPYRLLLSGLSLHLVAFATLQAQLVMAEPTLWAGSAKVDITHETAAPIHDRLHARVVVLRHEELTLALIGLDVVAIGGIGPIPADFLTTLRDTLRSELGIAPQHVLVNASHCHGITCADVTQRTLQAVRTALDNLEPVRVGVSTGHEDRIMENRRLKLRDGTEADVRHAYSLPPDAEVAQVGPIDPEIGVLRLDRLDGTTKAVIYNFACHPIQGVPGGGNTADLTGFASRTIEELLDKESVALFLQGCAGDINPVDYKDVHHPRDAELLGERLAISTLRAVKQATPRKETRLQLAHRQIDLPRRDVGARILELETEQDQLLRSLRGTSLDLKSFLTLTMKHGLDDDFPSAPSHRYLHEDTQERTNLRSLDAENRAHLEAYAANIRIMERLTRLATNLALLRQHQSELLEADSRAIPTEVLGLRIGDFVMVTFPGELTVEIGLAIKEESPYPATFVAGYTNGYLFYAPTAEQALNVGRAQEDSDCILAPQWEVIYRDAVSELLAELN